MSASLPKVTRRADKDVGTRIGKVKGRIEVGGLPVIDTEELQMAGYFVIPLRHCK